MSQEDNFFQILEQRACDNLHTLMEHWDKSEMTDEEKFKWCKMLPAQQAFLIRKYRQKQKEQINVTRR